MTKIEYTGTINCNCPIECLADVWNEEEERYELKCLKCGAKVTYYKSTKTDSEGTRVKRRRGSKLDDDDPTNTYKVPRGYQNWKAGYGYRRSFKAAKQ